MNTLVRGSVCLDLYEQEGGRLLQSVEGPNLITNVGFAFIAGLLSGETSWANRFIALGIGTTAAAATNTTLESEITTGGGARKIGTASRITTTQTNDTFRLTATFTFTGSFAITESGLLDAASAGILTARRVFAAVNVVNGNVLVVTWQIKVA